VNVAYDAFELVDVGEKPLPAAFGDPVDRLRPSRAAQFLGRYDAKFGKCVDVPVEIAVGEITSPLELGKAQAFRMRDQTGADCEPAALVKDALQAGIGEGRFACVAHAPRSRQTSQPIAI